MNVLSTFDFGTEKMQCIKKLGIKISFIKEKEIDKVENYDDFEIVICNRAFDYVNISKFSNLKWIQLVSAGADTVPFEIIKQANILLTNCKGAYSIPIAEWVISKILEIYKSSKRFYELQNNKTWEKYNAIYELNNKKACILGTGSIGVEIAKRLKVFGVEVTGVNSTGKYSEPFNKCFALENKNNIIGINDIIINTLPLTFKTTNLIDESFLAKMKVKSIFVNVSRGKILDEKALLKHLQSGHLLGAALDVFESEPLPASNPLWGLSSLIITPHVAYRSDIGNQRVFDIVFENLVRYKKGEDLINKVYCDKGY